jgi:hypothetical protein
MFAGNYIFVCLPFKIQNNLWNFNKKLSSRAFIKAVNDYERLLTSIEEHRRKPVILIPLIIGSPSQWPRGSRGAGIRRAVFSAYLSAHF